jgi:PAS domain S-box-containing protein
MVTDLSGKVVDINPAWSATLGWSADDLVGVTAEWLIHPDDHDRSFRGFVDEAAGNGAPHFQMRILHKDGSYRLLSWLAVRDRELIYAGARDITDLQQTQEKLQALRNRLAQSSRHTVVGALTASIAHEIKQPLAGIVTSASAGLRWLGHDRPTVAGYRRSRSIAAGSSQPYNERHRCHEFRSWTRQASYNRIGC